MMEVLAPAGSREALERADAAGADAVYLGYSAFSARAGAGNFDRDQLADAVRYAHLRHMRVYVTVNTLVKDAELPAVSAVLALLRDLRADAVLIQDMGILRLIRKRYPELQAHASTQMSIHNRTGVAWCRRMGMRRVVLARECPLEEIRLCCREPAEIEVFGHGAQCVSVSGQCLFSSMVGERSGNRGRCAQPCRRMYRFGGKEGAWLSPRDVCLRDDLPALAQAGVASVKLEGRLKRPEYVAVTTSAYRKGLDLLEAGAFRPVDEAETEALCQVFQRGSLMRGYAFGCEDAAVIDPLHVNHQGLPLGKVTEARGELVKVRLLRPLSDGDSLRIRHGRDENEWIYSGPAGAAGDTAVMRLRPGVRAGAGDPVFRLVSAEQTAAAAAMPGRRVPADLLLRAMPGEPLALRATDGESTVTVTGEVTAAARTRETGAGELVRNLSRTGDTVFVPGEIRVVTDGAFVPVSAVNALRREALRRLEERRIAAFERRPCPETAETAAVRTEDVYVTLRPGTTEPSVGWTEPVRTEDAYATLRPGTTEPFDGWTAPVRTEDADVTLRPGTTEPSVGWTEPVRTEDADVTVRPGATEPYAGRTEPAFSETVRPEGVLPPMAVARTAEQADLARRAGYRVIRRPEDYREEAMNRLSGEWVPGDWLHLPEVCAEATLRMLYRWVSREKDRLGGVVLGTVGQLGMDWPVPFGAGSGIPVMNRQAAALLLEQGCRFVTASQELTGQELKTLLKGRTPIAVRVYGRTQLMLLHHCPARTALGLRQGRRLCGLCDGNAPESLRGKTLDDSMGHSFPLLRERLPEGCRIRLMNALPTDWLDRAEGMQPMLEFTTESGGETERVLRAAAGKTRSGTDVTAGHWKRPVE